jgi:cation diffusion facilitator CzcD-associated flavoprotein CzcO
MEWYASAMELAVWTSSSVVKAEQDAEGNWTVQVNKGGKETRTLRPKHVVSVSSPPLSNRLHLRSWQLLSVAFL